MIIDFHNHPWFRESTSLFIDYMNEKGIDITVLFSMSEQENEQCLEMVKENPDRFVAFYWIDQLRKTNQAVEQMEADFETGDYKGIKFYPYIQWFYPDEKIMYPIYEKCIEWDIPIFFHTGLVSHIKDERKGKLKYCSSPVRLATVAEDFPDLKIVIGHMGGNFLFDALIVAEKHENVFLGTAWLWFYCQRMLPHMEPTDIIKHAVQVIGSKKILYGGEGLYPEVIRESDLSKEDKENILGENAKKLLRLGSST